jgi:glutamate-ammonia-ligase adenylyltransferase
MNAVMASLPVELQTLSSVAWSNLANYLAISRREVSLDQHLLESLCKVWAASRFVADWCRAHPDSLVDLIISGELQASRATGGYRSALQECLETVGSEADLMAALRRFRNREMVRIAIRDTAGWAKLDETLKELSGFAEACIQESLQFLYRAACDLRGTPVTKCGMPVQLVVLAMGKLGAGELNFSSDIDLIFAYPEDGILPDKQGTSFGEFFRRLCQSLVKVLSQVTEDGFVFRVDMRLRPFGESGPLVMSFSAMETYYQGQAREWERYAMIKARPVAGDLDAGKRLENLLRPFVYRRYLDYRAFGELRDLKQKITLELRRKERLENIKLGPGGIREIEFIGQAFQLIRGGRDKRLQQRRILCVLSVLGESSYLPARVVRKLSDAYCFLRTVENRLQQYADEQTHDLPQDELQQLGLAFSLGFPDWRSFKQRLDSMREQVHAVFEQVIEAPHMDPQEVALMLVGGVRIDSERLLEVLQKMGYRDAQRALQALNAFLTSFAIKKLTSKGVTELNRLMPILLRAVAETEEAEVVLQRLLQLLEAIASRNVYFTLLAENPLALSQLVKLSAASSWIPHHIASFPLLLDELLDPRELYAPLTKAELAAELRRQLDAVGDDELEQTMIALRQFKQTNVLRVAAADIMGLISVGVVSDYLTAIAEVIIDAVLSQAWQRLDKRGYPPGGTENKVTGFGVIAYGKLGGLELGYGSDLDLVFLYDGRERPPSCAQFYARLAQKMINMLTTQMLSGKLYEVDLRLRPSGNSGLLVSSVEAYARYQMSSAWTWEQQALVKARFIAGDTAIERRFTGIRIASLSRPRDLVALRQEVKAMRERMQASLMVKDPALFDLKQGAGGMADIEFIVQFGTLASAHAHPELLAWTSTIRLLESLSATGFLQREDFVALEQAYYLYREQVHRSALKETQAVVSNADLVETRERVQQIWRNIMA